MAKTMTCQLCVVGGGSGGIGAALAAARLGVDTLLIEKEEILGGTSTISGVNCWEPVAGATGIPQDIYRELTQVPGAVGIYCIGRHRCHPEHNTPPFPGGEHVISPNRTYPDTLLRSGTAGLKEDCDRCRTQWNGVVFEPKVFDSTVQKMLAQTGNCRLKLNSSFQSVTMKNESGVAPKAIESITLSDGTKVKADLWIDNCGFLARAAGAECLKGEDPRSRFDEPGAPEVAGDSVNGVTLIFRITPREDEQVDPLQGDIPADCWWAHRFPSLSAVHYPNGDINCNMLPTMSGAEYLELGGEKAMVECRRRVAAYWHYLQTEYPEFRRYRIQSLAERIGVRETFRVVCDYMLNENDLLAGIRKQAHSDIIALADHMMDSHGAGERQSGELTEPYGIPYRSLIPKSLGNLLVAGRIAGFSCIAASSCRLSRTMMQLGQAAGTAAALALETGASLQSIEPFLLRSRLIAQNVRLTWP